MISNEELIERALDESIESSVGLLGEASRHIIHAGGKRIRPKLVLLAYQSAGGQDPREAVPAAVAVELIHTASLVHDDINDRSDLRRGYATVNARWGNSVALLTGDFLFGRLLRLVSGFDSRIAQVLTQACLDVVEGETRQLLSLGNLSLSEDAYLDIVRQKTASLFAASTQLGGFLAGATSQQIHMLEAYGLNLGMAFQIWDDTLDLVGREDNLGKPVAADLGQKKASLALLVALKQSEEVGKLFQSGDIRGTLELLHETGAVAYAMHKAREYAQLAQDVLAALPDAPARGRLHEIAESVADRST